MVKQNLLVIFTKEIFSKPGDKTYETCETVVKDNDKTWTLVFFLDMAAYGITKTK